MSLENAEFPLIDISTSELLVGLFIVNMVSQRNASFHRLLIFLSPELLKCTFQIIPIEVCKRTYLSEVKTVLESNLHLLRSSNSSNQLSRTVFVELIRVSSWFAVMGLIDNNLERFTVALEFLLHFSCDNFRSVNHCLIFLVSYFNISS